MITIQTSDQKTIHTDKRLLLMCKTFKNCQEDMPQMPDFFVVPTITFQTMNAIIKFLEESSRTGLDQGWVQKYFSQHTSKNQSDLIQLINAAEYLECEPLYDVCIQHCVSFIEKCTEASQIRQFLNLQDDLTPEELEIIEKETNFCKLLAQLNS